MTGLPGSALQMRQTDITVTPVTTETLKTLKDVDTGQPVVASYLRGRDGALTESVGADAALEGVNLSAPDNALRGVGFRGGDFCDVPNIIPLTGAPATEIRGVYTPFYSKTWFPLQPWSVNYYDVSGAGAGGVGDAAVRHAGAAPVDRPGHLDQYSAPVQRDGVPAVLQCEHGDFR